MNEELKVTLATAMNHPKEHFILSGYPVDSMDFKGELAYENASEIIRLDAAINAMRRRHHDHYKEKGEDPPKPLPNEYDLATEYLAVNWGCIIHQSSLQEAITKKK